MSHERSHERNAKPNAFRRLTDFLARRGRLVLAITAILMIGSLVGIVQLDIDTRFTVFMPPHSEARQALEEMGAAFGDSGQLVALAGTSHEPEALKRLPDIAERLTALTGVSVAEPPIPERFRDLEAPSFSAALERLETFTGGATLPTYDGSSYATFRIMLADGANVRATVDRVQRVFDDEGMSVLFSGEPYLEAQVFDYVLRILVFLPPLAVILMLLVFRARIKSARATLLSMVPAIAGAVLTLGGVSWMLGSVSIVSVLVPIFVIVLGSADGLHVTSHVMDSLETDSEADNRHAVAETLRAVGVPIALTTVTTMAGFLSLLAINSTAIRGLAIMAAVGVLIAGIATWLILPALLLRLRPLSRHRSASGGRLERGLARMRGIPAVVLAVALIAALLPGALKLRANFSMIDVYKPSTEVRKSLDQVTAILGGAIPVYVTFPAQEPFDPALAEGILDFHDRVEEAGLVSHSASVYRTVARAAEEMLGADGYPDDQAQAERIASMIRATSGGFFDTFLASRATSNDLGRAVFFLSDLDNGTLDRFRSIARGVSAEHGVSLQAVGSAFVIQDMNEQIIPQQLGSLLLALGLVFLLSAAAQRSLVLGISSTIPIGVTLVVVFGVMGYARIDLSVITGIMSALTVGVGIDYAIHYASLYRHMQREGAADPARAALGYVATPVLANALGLAVGFTAMALSPLQIHVTLSILMWVTMIVSAVVTLTLLPTIIGRRPTGIGRRRPA